MRSSDQARAIALPLFAGVSARTLRELFAGAFLQRFPGGTTLLTEGDPVDFLYVLMEGMVELQGAWKHRETTLAVLQPVSTFNLGAVVLDSHTLATARTIERSEILMLPGEALRRAMKADADFCFAVTVELAATMSGMVRATKNQKLRGGAERLANYLLAQCQRQGGVDRISLPYEKRLLSSLLGMTPETLSRAFVTLGRLGVAVKGPEVTLSRTVAFERFARPTSLIDNHLPLPGRATGKVEREQGRSAASAR